MLTGAHVPEPCAQARVWGLVSQTHGREDPSPCPALGCAVTLKVRNKQVARLVFWKKGPWSCRGWSLCPWKGSSLVLSPGAPQGRSDPPPPAPAGPANRIPAQKAELSPKNTNRVICLQNYQQILSISPNQTPATVPACLTSVRPVHPCS